MASEILIYIAGTVTTQKIWGSAGVIS